ncbi:TPA: hypothetical protein ACPSKZ_003848 [Legionella anisa]|uniref:Vir protein n=1 Tax=Legionella anisa TaxID=28082 RepID=A0AAX0WV54_9GAMM|nr:hypothetical protein [Legionella anisa]AWN74930.1 hypothetical protein DLD14_14400 [Legionella anisa]MCW8424866.1 hypothetical protein [Legionella anisa]MCW8446015.1 hypothetical protein [Legionella anisa]PNL61111.1 hypothetical protein A6J39_007730 [Legionella anisa]UAK80143.1 hypothetical protein K8O89_03440 [Legionella anisa]
MDLIINSEELAAMSGLPHVQQLTYFRGIRPYMDIKTGLVGIKRRISYQSISEQLHVEPHQGIKSQSFSRDQVRRAVAGLVRAGIIEVQSDEMHLILKCRIATRAFSVQNKAATNPPCKAAINPPEKHIVDIGFSDICPSKADIVELSKAAIPLKDNNYIYLLSQFEKFWSLYPEKKSKHKAQAAFEALNPNSSLFGKLIQALQKQIQHVESMKLAGTWIPPWKYPANWLIQRCWEDECSTDALQETAHAKHTKNNRKPEHTADLFSPPVDTDDEPTNVIELKQFR